MGLTVVARPKWTCIGLRGNEWLQAEPRGTCPGRPSVSGLLRAEPGEPCPVPPETVGQFPARVLKHLGRVNHPLTRSQVPFLCGALRLGPRGLGKQHSMFAGHCL